MKLEELELLSSLKEFNFAPELLSFLPEPIRRFSQNQPDCFVLEGAERRFGLWMYAGQEEDLRCQLEILDLFHEGGFEGFLYPIQLADGSRYAQVDPRSWFFVTAWPELRKVRFCDPQSLSGWVELIVEIRKIVAFNRAEIMRWVPEKSKGLNLLETIQSMIANIHSFALLAKYRIRPTRFDRLFLAHVDDILSWAERAYQVLQDSTYPNGKQEPESNAFLLHKFLRRNFGKREDGSLICLNIKKWRWDLAIMDLAELLVKAGRSNQWQRVWYDSIMSAYRRHFAVTDWEQRMLSGYLMFPWDLFRVAQKYYFNLSAWSHYDFIIKLERRLAVEAKRQDFLKRFL